MFIPINSQLTNDYFRQQLIDTKEHYLLQSVCGENNVDSTSYVNSQIAKSTQGGGKVVMPHKIDKWKKDWQNQRDQAYSTQIIHNTSELYGIYQRSMGGELGLKILMHEIGRQSINTSPEGRNFGIINETSSGCIMNFKKWNILINDIVFMGAVHAKGIVA